MVFRTKDTTELGFLFSISSARLGKSNNFSVGGSDSSRWVKKLEEKEEVLFDFVYHFYGMTGPEKLSWPQSCLRYTGQKMDLRKTRTETNKIALFIHTLKSNLNSRKIKLFGHAVPCLPLTSTTFNQFIN